MANYTQFTADVQVKVGAGKMKGIFISNAASTPTLEIHDTLDGNTSDPKIIASFTPVSATMYFFGDDGIFFKDGLYLNIGNTVSGTVIWE